MPACRDVSSFSRDAFAPDASNCELDMQTDFFASAVRCREISEADVGGIVDLMARSFAGCNRDFWRRALDRIRRHGGVPGYPPLGYLLECGGSTVGGLLLVFTVIKENSEPHIRCSVSSWCVVPEFRSYAGMLASQALRRREVTYVNATPAPHTWPILEAQGFHRYSSGWFVSTLALNRTLTRCTVTTFTPNMLLGEDLTPLEAELLLRHQRWGCLSLVCTVDGRRSPFVFLPRRKRRIIPYVTLVFCRSTQDLTRCAGPLGRALLRQGFAITAIDSNGPIPGLHGWFMQGRPKYFRGPNPPRFGDLAYSELVIVGSS
jgi:hypothetical protein